MDKTMLSKYISILEKFGIIEKIMPVTESYRLKAKGALYFLSDNFFDFWFRFVYLNKQMLEEGKTGAVLADIKNSINNFLRLLPSRLPENPKACL